MSIIKRFQATYVCFIVVISICVTSQVVCEAARDGKCQGEVKSYSHAFFNCLLAGQHHKFCRYHYEHATYCPIHPCFNRVL